MIKFLFLLLRIHHMLWTRFLEICQSHCCHLYSLQDSWTCSNSLALHIYSLLQAVRRRFDKRIYIPLPDAKARQHMFKVFKKSFGQHNIKVLSRKVFLILCLCWELEIIQVHLGDTPHSLSESDFEVLGRRTEGFSGSDVAVCVSSYFKALTPSHMSVHCDICVSDRC
jgi:SpoVK/Ycf46/Vps4 family AAA+-type ATPase